MYLLSALHSFLYYLHPPSHFLISYLCPLLLMERTYIPRSNKLLHSSPSSSPSVTPTIIPFPMENDNSDTSSSGSFDVIVVLAAMLCALVCALGLNSMLQCVIRCARQMVTEPVEWVQSLRENVGLKKEDVWALPVATYNTSSSPATATAPTSGCAICLVDFSDGDRVRCLQKISSDIRSDMRRELKASSWVLDSSSPFPMGTNKCCGKGRFTVIAA
ncbi:hypothetical protein H6P81_019170 [Aristolochia fimbriata]|uniref:Uncharacterized protein n=1 Tax=Aristolochia fimbriata TaxID=158543 RepID=A0AAV7DR15_ARIFI|nr:hypothetical protein H6P81_019170 [Aristolochia fimbriata]